MPRDRVGRRHRGRDGLSADLAGRIAVVTGGSRGIGRAIAESLAVAGARVAVVSRGEDGARTAAAALPGGGHVGIGCDIADPAAVNETVRSIEENPGPIDILVNNAGITDDNLLVRITDESWDRVLDTNLKGAFNFIRATARGMMRRRSGRIINITSVVGLTGNKGQASYAASKAGLIGLTKAVAKELASRNVLCNAIAPGFIETEMTAKLSEAVRTSLVQQIALGRLGTGEDVGGVVSFLAGPAAGYITGQVIVVDGGMVI
jgi:3-oxoacyl-[acyl-carrier protein] reductase